MADRSQIASAATGAATLVLAMVSVAAVRASHRSVWIAAQALVTTRRRCSRRGRRSRCADDGGRGRAWRASTRAAECVELGGAERQLGEGEQLVELFDRARRG